MRSCIIILFIIQIARVFRQSLGLNYFLRGIVTFTSDFIFFIGLLCDHDKNVLLKLILKEFSLILLLRYQSLFDSTFMATFRVLHFCVPNYVCLAVCMMLSFSWIQSLGGILSLKVLKSCSANL